MPSWIVLSGPDKGRVFDVFGEPFAIGRGGGECSLSDQTVSRRHAQVTPENGEYALEDLNSANGTFVNGAQISNAVRLKAGDQIRVGATVMVFGGTAEMRGVGRSASQFELVELAADDQIDSSVLESVRAFDDSVVIASPEAADAVENLRTLYQLSQALGSMYSVPQLLERVMDIVFEKIDAERGFVLMRDQETDSLAPVAVRHRDPSVAIDQIQASNTIVRYVMDRGQSVLCANAQGDQRFTSGQSVHHLGIRSVICVPIVARGNILGVIHVDSSISEHTFTEDQLRLLSAIGSATGLGVENANLVQTYMHAERRAASGEAVALISHYMKNILQGLGGGAEMVDKGLTVEQLPKIEKGWRIVDRNLRRIYELATNLLAYSTERSPRYQSVDLRRLISEIVDLVQRRLQDKKVKLVTDVAANVPSAMLDEDGIHQALLNVIGNAIDAVKAGEGVIQVRCSRREPGILAIDVTDNGPGVPTGTEEDVFELFKSTKGHGGTGLGLPVAKKIVSEHQGEIRIRSTGRRTVCSIELPLTRKSPLDESASRTHFPSPY